MSSIAVAFYQSSPLGNLRNQTLSLAPHPQGINVQSDSVEYVKNCSATASFPIFRAVGRSFFYETEYNMKIPNLRKKVPQARVVAHCCNFSIQETRQEENAKFKTNLGYIVK